jgi:hypothetical protein
VTQRQIDCFNRKVEIVWRSDCGCDPVVIADEMGLSASWVRKVLTDAHRDRKLYDAVQRRREYRQRAAELLLPIKFSPVRRELATAV